MGNVVIAETVGSNITSLIGLEEVQIFEQFLEIHDNDALLNLKGLDNVSRIGGLNISGNSALQTLSGLEKLETVVNSLRIAHNHNLRNILSLGALLNVDEDLTITDNTSLPNLKGLKELRKIGGHLMITLNESLITFQGLDSLGAVGNGLLVEANPNLQRFQGLSNLASVGGNCMFIDNFSLRTLRGLEALSSVGGNFQIAKNPFLAEVTALFNLSGIDGQLLIFENKALKDLNGLDNIDHRTIRSLGILDSDILSACSVKSICDYLAIDSNVAAISFNGTGCNFRAQILERCSGQGQSHSFSARKDPVFFPNPTSGLVTVRGEGLKEAIIEVNDGLGRILIQEELKDQSVDLSELAAGMYFIRLSTERFDFIQKIIKLN